MKAIILAETGSASMDLILGLDISGTKALQPAYFKSQRDSLKTNKQIIIKTN